MPKRKRNHKKLKKLIKILIDLLFWWFSRSISVSSARHLLHAYGTPNAVKAAFDNGDEDISDY
jgi:hypothetical protein